ncbi:MAG: DUF1016 domain-containing protein [Candidatus Cloacimonadota bacterium]|nr:MAG: DUF1016 domain-containing protein [Candidatus Cloacimonadota bacterium]
MQKITKSRNYKKLLERVSTLLEEARKKTVRQINTIIVETYWNIGKLIVEEEQKGKERAEYGEKLLLKLSNDLTKRFGKGFTDRNLRAVRQFYLVYPKLHALRTESLTRKKRNAPRAKFEDKKITTLYKELSWTHFRSLMRIEDENSRHFYEIETVKNNWSTRELQRQIDSLLFERLALSKNKEKVKQLARKGQFIEKPEDAIKDPYILEFLGLPEKNYYSESQLERKLIDHLQEFILELGKGFTFVGRQKRITIDNEHYYIDLVFYHRILRCLVLIDLKVGKLDHKDVGQMNFYLNYIKNNEILEDENPPVGIILCTESKRSKIFIEYALGGLSNKVFVSKYKLYLPTKKELEQEIKGETIRLEQLPRKKRYK